VPQAVRLSGWALDHRQPTSQGSDYRRSGVAGNRSTFCVPVLDALDRHFRSASNYNERGGTRFATAPGKKARVSSRGGDGRDHLALREDSGLTQ
jgi:hypothetical protein